MRYLFSLVLFIACYNSSFSQSGKKISFDDNWKFHLGNASDPAKDFNYSIGNVFKKSGATANTAIDIGFPDSAWSTVQLPHDWAVKLPFVKVDNEDVMAHGYKPVGGLFPATSIGWYRKHFRVAASDSGRRMQIQFDGIFRDATVWINGFYVGNNKSGYVGIAYDVTDFINYDRDNVIVVRVDATQYEGWFYEGAGIYRHAWMRQCDNLHIVSNGIFAYSTVNDQKATVYVETTLENKNGSAMVSSVSSEIRDRQGNVVGKSTDNDIALPANGTVTVKQKMMVQRSRLWSIEDPYLYRIRSSVTSSGKMTDDQEIRFGIRTIEVTADGVFLNKKYIKIKGTNNHQDHGGLGSALPDYLQYYRIQLLKAMGSNAYRTSHHAPAPELLDACDSLGMLVLDEQRLLNSSPEYVDQFTRLIKRDRSHTCVFLWSIGNEEGWIQTRGVGKRVAQSLLAIQKELDPTRTSTYAADLPNVFSGVNEVIPVRGFNYRHFAVEAYHHDHPSQPVIGTEMGSTVTTRGMYVTDSIRAYLPDLDVTSPPWASTAEAWWPLFAANKWILGGFVWTGFDYRGEPTPYQWPNINSHFGVMDMCGFPKNIYYYYQSWWSDSDVLHISPHWNWKGRENQPIDVWVNSNADNVELFLNGKSLGKKNMPVNSHLQWKVPYQPGTLMAIGYRKGKKFTQKVETTGDAVAIKLQSSKSFLRADGQDVAVVNISAVDSKGREVPDANNKIHFTLSGDASFIGVANGDPSSHEPDQYDSAAIWERSLFNGKCQMIIRSGKTKQQVMVLAATSGLRAAETKLSVE